MKRNNTLSGQKNFTIHVIGVNAGGVEELPNSLKDLIISTKKLAGSPRIIHSLNEWWQGQKFNTQLPDSFESNKTNEIIDWIKRQEENVILLSSGDPLWYGIGRLLTKHFPKKRLSFHPSPTSLQLAFSKLGIPWHDAEWISLHGRDPEPLKTLLKKRPKSIGILTDPNHGGAEVVRQFLKASELEGNYAFWIFEKLGHPQESFQRIDPSKQISQNIDPLHLVVLIKDINPQFNKRELPLFGLEDGLFLQHPDRPGLMTKREVRVQILSDLELPLEGVIWDIGAGVGSIGIEALRIRPNLKLLSIEKRIGGKQLIEDNAKRLFINPSKIIEADALELLQKDQIPSSLSNPSRVVIGGGGVGKYILLEEVLKKLQPGGIIVIPLTTLESLQKIELVLKDNCCDYKVSQHQNYRGISIGNGTRLSPMNPVFIVKSKLI